MLMGASHANGHVLGGTSPVAAEDVARVVAELLADPQPHVGKTYHLTDRARKTCISTRSNTRKALGRLITYQDIPVEPWREKLLERGLPPHVVNHLSTMADLHRAGRYDRRSDDVLELTGQGALSVQDFVRKNAAALTTSKPNPERIVPHAMLLGWLKRRARRRIIRSSDRMHLCPARRADIGASRSDGSFGTERSVHRCSSPFIREYIDK
ncbi:hypothetical protein [Paraburkholderia aromaticivorans]|uniref:hypothetical protein n=1 Tax=Paraburkholderia aromaticivorans TaxID=2026199 RepID=UPI00197E8012|nr:hypothetical protein [Paraburkholderia aromaticivorans]